MSKFIFEDVGKYINDFNEEKLFNFISIINGQAEYNGIKLDFNNPKIKTVNLYGTGFLKAVDLLDKGINNGDFNDFYEIVSNLSSLVSGGMSKITFDISKTFQDSYSDHNRRELPNTLKGLIDATKEMQQLLINIRNDIQSNQQTNENKQYKSIMKIKAKDLKKILTESKTKSQDKKTITVKDLKQKLNEGSGLGFGYGFKNQHSSFDDLENPKTQKNQKKIANKVNKPNDYMGKKGGTMFGYGFALQEQLEKLSKDPKKLASLIEDMVKSMKGKSDYTNLNFVDNVAKKYNVNESEIKKMKSIILKENSPKTALKLYNYITECSCQQAESTYGKYAGLKNESSEMIPNIKRTFNKFQSGMNSPQDAFGATSKQLGLPMEMVEEMYEIQKEAQKMKTEGQGGNISETDSKLQNVFEKYQKMSEGDMYEMYDEMAEYMDYPSSDDITAQAINDGSIYERDDFDSVVGGGDDDDRFDNKFSLRDMQRGIDAEPDEHWAFGKHSDPIDDDDVLDVSDEHIGSHFNFDEDGDIVDMSRFDDRHDDDELEDNSFPFDDDSDETDFNIENYF